MSNLTYFNNSLTIIGRPTKDPSIKESTSTPGSKFLYVDIACPKGYSSDTTFINGLLFQGRKVDNGFDNKVVEAFAQNVSKGDLVSIKGYIDGFKKGEEYVNVLRMTDYRILVKNKHNGNGGNGESGHPTEPADPMSGL